jgi:rRNA maturation RNase YbeY
MKINNINIKAVQTGLNIAEINDIKLFLKLCYLNIINLLKQNNNNVVYKNPNIPFFVDVLLINDINMLKYNFKFRNKKATTNVLSLQNLSKKELASKTKMPYILLGDVIISITTAQREANNDDISYKEHILRLFIHGVLHLLGFDHNNEKQAKEMFDLENNLLKLSLNNNQSSTTKGLVSIYFNNN